MLELSMRMSTINLAVAVNTSYILALFFFHFHFYFARDVKSEILNVRIYINIVFKTQERYQVK